MLEIPGSLHSFLTGRRQAARLDYFYFLNGALWDEERELEAIRRTNPPFALVRDLPEDQRKVLELRFVEEKSTREVAEALGRSEGAIKQLQFRALESLRARIGGKHG